jgi:transposase-like protein
MVRTQIQLTERQAQSLRRLARRYGLSVAELVRRGVDQVLASGPSVEADQKKRKAMAASGRFRSGRRDVSVRHDHYLAKDSHK